MCRLSASQTRGLGTRPACLLTWSGSGTSGGPCPRSSQCACLVLKECPRCTCCGRPTTQRLCRTTVPVQDGTGMEICNATAHARTIGKYLYVTFPMYHPFLYIQEGMGDITGFIHFEELLQHVLSKYK